MEEIKYEDWYPEVPPVMETKDLAELLHTNEQIIRAWVREGTMPPIASPAAASTPSYATKSSTGSSATDTNLRPKAAKQSIGAARRWTGIAEICRHA